MPTVGIDRRRPHMKNAESSASVSFAAAAACRRAAGIRRPQGSPPTSCSAPTVDGETIEGKPLAWTDYEMHLLGRDGRLHEFNPQDAKDAKKTSPTFVGYSCPR